MKNKNFQKKVREYMKKPYRIEIEPDPDGGYVAWIKELPGCITYGETLEETLKMLEEAKELYIETALARGKKLPEPVAERKYSGKFLLRISPALHERLAEMAADEGVSLNALVNRLIVKALSEKEIAQRINEQYEQLEQRLKRIEELMKTQYVSWNVRSEFGKSRILKPSKSLAQKPSLDIIGPA